MGTLSERKHLACLESKAARLAEDLTKAVAILKQDIETLVRRTETGLDVTPKQGDEYQLEVPDEVADLVYDLQQSRSKISSFLNRRKHLLIDEPTD